MQSVITPCAYNDTREDNTSPTTRARFNLIHKTDGAAVIAGANMIYVRTIVVLVSISDCYHAAHEIAADAALLLFL